MRTLAILPVKSFSRAKRRLGKVDGAFRESLVEAMLGDVLCALDAADEVSGIVVVTADDAPVQLAMRSRALVLRDSLQGHNPAAALGIEAALRQGYDRALLVPGDCPAVDPAELDALLRHAGAPPSGAAAPRTLALGSKHVGPERQSSCAPRAALIVPDRHGTGTNGLVLTPPDALQPSFGAGSCERHAALARALGVHAEVADVPSLALDIDTPEDLAALASLPTAGARRTRELLSRC